MEKGKELEQTQMVLKQAHDVISSLTKEQDEMKLEQNVTIKEIENLEMILEETQDVISSLKMEQDELKKKQNDTLVENEQLQAKLKEAYKIIDSLTAEQDKLKIKQSDTLKENEELQKELKKAHDIIDSLVMEQDNSKDMQNRMNKKFEMELKEAEDIIFSLTVEQDELKNKNTDALEENEKLQCELKKAHDIINSLVMEQDNMENKQNEKKKKFEMDLKEAEDIIVSFTMEQDDLKNKQNVLEIKLKEAQDIINSLKMELNELRVEKQDIFQEKDQIHRVINDVSGTNMALNFLEFSCSEIQEATHEFDDSFKIGEGGYGSVYKCLLRQTTAALKILNSNNLQGMIEFCREVDILSRMRHPNLVSLLGACPQAHCLIYEFLPNGSLEDCLDCKNNSAPLSWQVRIRIATEICSALIFLHSSEPQSIVHGNLKPSNVLLDANLMTKLGDFGLHRFSTHNNTTSNVIHKMSPNGTFEYMDPEFLSTGVLIPHSDTYSFGLVILYLLTGRHGKGMLNEVREALEHDNLHDIVDETAGDWPFVQAKQFAHLGLRCCEIDRSNRPKLAGEVWGVLEPMRASSSVESLSSPSQLKSIDTPYYFLCPIIQDVMVDPLVAADGYTYEAEAIRGWFDSGHDTSPMTNTTLPNLELLPNHALRSVIQEWLQQQRSRH